MTTSADERQPALCADAALLRRVQHHNQDEVIGKLLHDLRNPVHSVRIAVELFSRLARQDADTTALITRAARYVGPAEAALASLSKQTERLAAYLCPPAPPSLQPINVNEWLAEIALLARESTRTLEIGVESGVDDEARLMADRPRLSHAMLRWCLDHAAIPAALRARAADADRVYIEAACVREPLDSRAAPFTKAELRMLIESAGGEIGEIGEAEDGGVTLSFARAR